MRQALGPGALGRPRGIGWRGRWEWGSDWGTHVTPWLIHFNVWQNPLQKKKKKTNKTLQAITARKKKQNKTCIVRVTIESICDLIQPRTFWGLCKMPLRILYMGVNWREQFFTLTGCVLILDTQSWQRLWICTYWVGSPSPLPYWRGPNSEGCVVWRWQCETVMACQELSSTGVIGIRGKANQKFLI